MNSRSAIRKPMLAAIVASNLVFATCASAADIKGQVLGVGGGMQQMTDIGIDAAGNVWVADNWERPDPVTPRAAKRYRLSAVETA